MKLSVNRVLVTFALVLIMTAATFSVTFAAGTVSGVKLTPGTENVKLTWNSYDGADYYVVRCAGVEYETSGTSYNVPNLKVATKYGVLVRAYDEYNNLIADSGVKSTTTKGNKTVTGLKAHAGYKSITITFAKDPGAYGTTYYRLYRSTKKNKGFKLIKNLTSKNNTDKRYNTGQIFYRDTVNGNIKRNTPYYYRVFAVRKTNDGKTYTTVSYAQASAREVRQMYQRIKVGGTWYTANGFSGGKYYTVGGNVFSVNSVRDASCDYSKNSNYTNRTAENFVNEYTKYKKKNGKNRMIWISTYTQHLYVFKWNAKKKMWKIDKHWECSTGKAGSPTPMNKSKDLDHKHRTRHGLPYWNCFSSCNAMHGRYSGWDMGVPRSGGCVRNPNYRAEYIYDNVARGSAVMAW